MHHSFGRQRARQARLLPAPPGAANNGWAVPGSAGGATGALSLTVDPLRLCLLALIVVNISRIHQHFSFIAALRPGLLLTGAALGLTVLFPESASYKNALTMKPVRLVLGLFALSMMSALFGLSLGSSANFFLEEYSKTLVVFFILAAAVRSASDLYTFVWGYLVGCAILVWMAWFVFDISAAGSLTARLGDLYSYDANDVGAILSVGLGLAMLAFTAAQSKLGKVGTAALLVGIGVTIARTGSRGAFLGVAAMMLFLLVALTHVQVWKRVATVVVVALAFAIAAPPGYWEQMRTIGASDDYNYTSTTGRMQTWGRALGYVARYPVFGVGINNFPRAEWSISEQAQSHIANTPLPVRNAHNTYLQAAAELGVPGFILWTMLTLGSVFQLRRLRRRLPPGWARGRPDERFLYQSTLYVPVAIIGMIVTTSFISFAYVDPPYVLFAIIAGVVFTADRLLHANPAPAPPVRSRAPRTSPRRGT